MYDIRLGNTNWPVIQNFTAYGKRAGELPAFNLSALETPTGAKARLSYATDGNVTAKLFAAAYDVRGVLLKVVSKDVTLGSVGAEELAIDFNKAGVAYVNAFLWDMEYIPLLDKAVLMIG